jgi:hypothetical protein
MDDNRRNELRAVGGLAFIVELAHASVVVGITFRDGGFRK